MLVDLKADTIVSTIYRFFVQNKYIKFTGLSDKAYEWLLSTTQTRKKLIEWIEAQAAKEQLIETMYTVYLLDDKGAISKTEVVGTSAWSIRQAMAKQGLHVTSIRETVRNSTRS